MEYQKRLRNANSVIFFSVAIMILNWFYLLDTRFFILSFALPPLTSDILDPYWDFIITLQITAVTLASFLLLTNAARQLNTTSYRFIYYSLLACIIVTTIAIACCLYYSYFPFMKNIEQLDWLFPVTFYLYVLSNIITGVVALKSRINNKILNISFWILAVVVFGMVLEVISTLDIVSAVWIMPEHGMESIEFELFRVVLAFPPGNQYLWLMLGMTLIIVPGIIVIWAYIKCALALFNAKNTSSKE